MAYQPTAANVIAWYKEERSRREAAEAELETSEYRLMTAAILLGNLLSSGVVPDDPDEAAGWQADCATARAFIDAYAAARAAADTEGTG